MKKLTIIAFFMALFANITFAAEVNVFSARHYDSDVQLYEKFTAKTGIKVNIVSGKDKALQKRIIEEGAESKADLYITADAGRLGAFASKGMFQNSLTPAIKAAVPSNFRTSKWTGIAKRARIIYYSPERVNANDLNGMTYEGLADPKWKGRVVIRKSNNIYNQSLVASLIKNNGKKATGINLFDFVKKLDNIGIGEIVLNSIERDGKMNGYDLVTVQKVKDIFQGPITVLGGAGCLDDIMKLTNKFKIIGAAAGSLFVFKGKYKAVLINYPNREERKPIY